MKIKFLGHGLVSQSTDSVGRLLINSLQDKKFKYFTALVAFASEDGVTGISDHIIKSKKHLKEIKIFVGVDQKGTSKEALEALLSLKVKSFVYFTTSRIIYHPKIYLLEGDKDCKVIIGSSNLTTSGLFRNIEASLIVEFRKPDIDGKKLLRQINDYFKSILSGKNTNIHKLTKKLIQDLVKIDIIPTEAERRNIQEKEGNTIKEAKQKRALEKLKKLFPAIKVQNPPSSFKPKPPAKKPKTKSAKADFSKKGKLLWYKNKLPGSDVQYSPLGTNPTGGLRLTQAGFIIDGKVINQTTYFRSKLFGKFYWKTVGTNPHVELAKVKFNIKILNKNLGQYQLEIRHKPSGEAGQKNYTTLISWGPLGDIIRKSNLIGKDLLLYAPEQGKKEPFFLEIK